jgi:hypothetical protein
MSQVWPGVEELKRIARSPAPQGPGMRPYPNEDDVEPFLFFDL